MCLKLEETPGATFVTVALVAISELYRSGCFVGGSRQIWVDKVIFWIDLVKFAPIRWVVHGDGSNCEITKCFSKHLQKCNQTLKN